MLASGDSRLGTTIENYRLLRVLGAGSTSVVYLGQRLEDEAVLVAVKVLTLDEALRPADRAFFQMRFLREARAASRLRHDHILPVLSYGEADDCTYMVMPVILHGTIATRLATQHDPLPLVEVAQYLHQLASALDYAHQQGVVHRDVKPSNVLLDDNGQIYLSDFGIARLFDASGGGLVRTDGGPSSLTHTGEVLGTPYYMAPEQIKSEPVGPATDIYALGVVIYQLVTGQLPYPGETPLAVAMQHLQDVPCPPHLLRQEVPPSMEAAILRALAKLPAERFRTASAFAQAFAAELPPAHMLPANSTASATRPASRLLTPADQDATSTQVVPPEALSPGALSPGALSPGALSPGALSPGALSPGALSPGALSPGALSPGALSPGALSPGALSPGALSPGALSPGRLGPSPLVARSPGPSMSRFYQLPGATLGHYRLDQLIDSDELGAVYLAWSDVGSATYRLRVLPIDGEHRPEASSLYLARFQQLSHDIAALQHPYLLPLLDYGTSQGMPYLVTPVVAGASLNAHLAQGGPMELPAVGRYLHQIAAALEYAHGRGLLHLNLTTSCTFLQLDGHVVVADLEVRRLIELGRRGAPRLSANPRGEPFAPEQLLDRPVDTSTDVYALGGMLYELLTGHPVFTGDTRDEIAEQHLHAMVPSLRKWRAGLPVGLDSILARALAKDPAQRFRYPGELSNAYRQLIDPSGASMSLTGGATPAESVAQPPSQLMVSGGPQASALPLVADQDTVIQRTSAHDEQPQPQAGSAPPSAPPTPPSAPPPREIAPHQARTPWLRRRSVRNVISAVILLSFVGGIFALLSRNASPPASSSASHAGGQVVLLDSRTGPPGFSNALSISVTGLAAAPAGSEYDAWLVDDATERLVALGSLTPQKQNYALSFDGSDQQPGINLLAAGNRVEITVERGPVQAPAGNVVLTGIFPPLAFNHIRHLLVAWTDTPHNVGFLVGLLSQTQQISAQGARLPDSAQAHNTTDTRCLAQSLIDIIEGQHGPNYQPLGFQCTTHGITATGDGYGLLHYNGGVLGYLDGAADHASLAASQPDATAHIRTHAQHVEIAVTNIKQWATTIDQDAVNLVQNPSDLGKVQEIATLADHVYRGVDTNGDEQVDPVPGEAGAVTAYEHGQLLAMLDLTPTK